MDTRRIHNFIAVLEAGSIARAANKLHIAQPALSAQMRQLEEMVGKPLLTRSAKGVVPTPLGIAFKAQGTELLRMADVLRSLGREFADEPEGHVNVGLPSSVANMLATQLVQTVVQRFPRVELGLLESTSDDLGHQLVDGRLDVAVLFADNLTTGMQHHTVLEEDLFVVRNVAMPAEVPLASLHDLALVVPARPNSVRLLLDKACAQRGVQPRILAEISSPHTTLRLARAGLGAAVQPWSMLANESLEGLHAARILSPRMTRTICIATIAGQVPQASRHLAVRDILHALLRALVQRSDWRGARIKKSSRSVL